LARGSADSFYAGVYYFADGFQEFDPRILEVLLGGWRDAESIFDVIEDFVAGAVSRRSVLIRFMPAGLLICVLLAHTASFISTVRT
jgi:hypothetical protein